jgi:hypothetical protein
MQTIYETADGQFDFNAGITTVAMVGRLEEAGYSVRLQVPDGKHICVFCPNLAQDSKPLCKQCEETRS